MKDSKPSLPAQTLPTFPSTEGKRVYKTFLFTDIVKSTDIRAACIREFGDRGNERYDNEVLTPHDELLDDLIPQFNGEVISTAGDSYFTAFTYARDAVQCAVAIQRTFIEKKIPLPRVEPNLPPYLQIRIGLHTGPAREVSRADKPNYSDHTINIAARIEGLADGEQVLMSEETWNNAGRLEGLTKHEWESYALKGVDGVWTLVEALWDGRNPRRPQISPPVPSPTSAATVEAFDIFGGRVEIVTDELLSHPATSNRLQQFYAGAKLDWDIIAAHGDIPRDQQGELLEQASQPFEGMRLICLVAEAGAGKSTLAWRAVAELHQQHKALVMHIKDSDDADLWYRLPEFCTKVGRPFFVLVDDIFHDPDSVSAFHELSPWLPITVLATSRPNEYRPRRLKCEALRLNLKPPSPDEKERLLQRLGKSRSDLTAEQQRRLDAANQFLVLMIEVVAGKELREIVRDTIERLRELDEPAHRAYEYLCFAYQHTIAIPISLLERLDTHGRFHNLPERETTQGLIFWDSREGLVRVGHPIIAETAATFYAQHRSPQAVLTDITTAVDTANASERRSLAFLLRALAKTKSPILTTMPKLLESGIARCVFSANRITELTVWRFFYRYYGQHQEAEKCVDSALTLEPVSSPDCNMLLKLYREHGREQEALPAIANWVRDHPEQGGGRVAYLGLIERYGTTNDVETVLQEINVWLAAHPDDRAVREAYLGFVERKGTPDQVAQVVKETNAWLATHPEDVNVRSVWLNFVAVRGSDDLKEATLADTKIWLAAHPLAKEVWGALLGCLFRAGRSHEAVKLVMTAILHHPNDPNLLRHYLRVVQDSADEQTIRRIYEQLIAKYPRDQVLPAHYARWLHEHGYHEEAALLYKGLIAKASRSYLGYYGYGVLLLKLERFDEAAIQFREVLNIHRGHQMAHNGLAWALWKLGDHTQAEREFRSAIYWAGMHEQPQKKFYGDLGWFYLDCERWRDALNTFESARDEDPDYYRNYWGIGRALKEQGDYAAAADALRTALEKEPNLEPPASEEIPELLHQCLEHLSSGRRDEEN